MKRTKEQSEAEKKNREEKIKETEKIIANLNDPEIRLKRRNENNYLENLRIPFDKEKAARDSEECSRLIKKANEQMEAEARKRGTDRQTLRAIDKKIARDILKLKEEHGFFIDLDCPYFTLDIKDAWEIVEKIGYVTITSYKTEHIVCFLGKEENPVVARANSVPLAICLAALKLYE